MGFRLRRVKGFFLRAFCCVSLNLCADMLHNLFRCRACGAVLDLETVPYDERLDRLAAARGCVVTGHTLIFTGHCPRCAGQDGRHEYRPEEKRDNCKI